MESISLVMGFTTPVRRRSPRRGSDSLSPYLRVHSINPAIVIKGEETAITAPDSRRDAAPHRPCTMVFGI